MLLVKNEESFIQYRCEPWFRLAVFAGEVDSYAKVEHVLILVIVVDVELAAVGGFREFHDFQSLPHLPVSDLVGFKWNILCVVL